MRRCVAGRGRLDRLLHRSVTITIRGDSYRLKDKRKAGLIASVTPQSVPAEATN